MHDTTYEDFDGSELEAQSDEALFEFPWEAAFQDRCPQCGASRQEAETSDNAVEEPADIVTNAPSESRKYGPLSSYKSPTFAIKKCTKPNTLRCPDLKGLEDVRNVAGVPFEYIGGWDDHPGINYNRKTKRWSVVEANRQRNRLQRMLPRAGDCLHGFLSNMKAVNLPVAVILTMGSVVCRCIKNTNSLSNHSYGDAIDIGGLRFTDGSEILSRNFEHAADRKILHRVNACLRLSFATVIDYHRGGHKDHFHCDTNRGNGRQWGVGWSFVRESLGLPVNGGWSKSVAEALRKFAGSQDAVKDRPALDGTLSRLFIREAKRA